MRRPLLILAALVVAGSIAGWYLTNRASQPVAVTAAHDVPKTANSASTAAIANPVPKTATPLSLPSLADSDNAVSAAIIDTIRDNSAARLLDPNNIVRHIVATVDNLPRRKLNTDLRPVRAPPGIFRASGDDSRAVMAADNYGRYNDAIFAMRAIDAPRLTAVYFRFYPLFQRAYQDLGYPNGYFNDRLIEVIDHLLATPDPPEPIELVRPNVFYEFTNPQLEGLSAGQKLMIRIGPDNRATAKAKLFEIRVALARRVQ